MSYKIVATHTFSKELKRLAKKHRSIKEDVYKLGEQLEENPAMGDEVIEHCYKIRLAITSKNKGKSGGTRVISYVYFAQKLCIYSLSTTKENKKILATSNSKN